MELPYTERVAVLATAAQHVPPAWSSVFEHEGWPTLRYASWDELLREGELPDVVYVFPDLLGVCSPRDERVERRLAGTRWVAVLPNPEPDDVRQVLAQGYREVMELDASPALVLGPVLRVRELRSAAKDADRLLEESLNAYDELRWLDRVRRAIRILDFEALANEIVREYAGALGEQGGYLWRVTNEGEAAGVLTLAANVEVPRPETARMLLHALPQPTTLMQGQPIQTFWHGRETAWVPLVDDGLLSALIEVPRESGRRGLLRREIARIRMLSDWMGIALRNSLETEQLRRVLSSRHGGYFDPPAFRQHVEKAIRQARRYRRPFALAALHYDGAEPQAHRLFDSVLSLLRDADVCAQPEGTRATIFLPETGYLGGVQFLRRVHRELRQSFRPSVLRRLTGGVVAYPAHGEDFPVLLEQVDTQLQAARAVQSAVRAVGNASVANLGDIFREHAAPAPLQDPNDWADLAFHLVQETTVVAPQDSRLLLYLGRYSQARDMFAPAFDLAARWDRILVVAGIEEGAQLPQDRTIKLIRDEALLDTYLAILERPSGAVAVWARLQGGSWSGGVIDDPLLVRAAFNRFEDQYMLHQRWVGS